MATATSRERRLGRLERSAITGVLVREIVNYSSYWRAATFSSTVEPTIYLLAFGFGFGSLVSTVSGYDYINFIGTGIVATAVLFSSAFPAMFGTFVKYQFQRTYDAILAAPVDTEELVTAEAIWIATRAGVYGNVPLLVAMVFGLPPAWGMLAVPFICWISGFGWACFGISVAGFAKSIDNFSYIVSAVLTPLFLVAGTFFPIEGLPELGAVSREPQPALPLRRARAARGVRLGGVERRRERRLPRPLRAADVAARDPGDDTQADQLGVKLERQPEQREERLGVEEEAELDDPAVLDLEHLERPRLVAVAALVRLVLAERRRAVGGHGRDHPGALAADAGAEPPGEDVVAAAEPEVERRHRLGRVLVDERR